MTAPTTPLPPAQPPDRLAFTRATPLFGPGLQHAEVVLVNDDGTDQVQLTHASADGLVASQPAWSPDRRRLAYIESTPAGAVNAGTGNIVIVDSDGTSPGASPPAGPTHIRSGRPTATRSPSPATTTA